MIPFWNRINTLLGESMTHTWLRQEIGIEAGTMSSWIAENSIPESEVLQKIADALCVSVDYLLTGEEWAEPKAQDQILHISDYQLIPIVNLPGEPESFSGRMVPFLESNNYQDGVLRAVDIHDDIKRDIHLHAYDIAIYQRGFSIVEGIYVISENDRFLVRNLQFNTVSRTVSLEGVQYCLDDPPFRIEGKVIAWFHDHYGWFTS